VTDLPQSKALRFPLSETSTTLFFGIRYPSTLCIVWPLFLYSFLSSTSTCSLGLLWQVLIITLSSRPALALNSSLGCKNSAEATRTSLGTRLQVRPALHRQHTTNKPAARTLRARRIIHHLRISSFICQTSNVTLHFLCTRSSDTQRERHFSLYIILIRILPILLGSGEPSNVARPAVTPPS